ncbi:LacI family DNA-binding transcriptional regulator [Aliiglaciecola litoralis]|uniref:LacI family DNA-binding transcriptional regulator n=1 Tax=Aliiglaciecola litoralis TaxID=582857 RepID=A0ABP3WPF2_9ALTE
MIIKKKLNLKQVSAHLGVSTATVSNAFNRPDQLSAKLRERILREAAELGYNGPNLAARTLRRGESEVIGVMLLDSLKYSLSDPVANQLLQGIAEVLVSRNKHMLLLSGNMHATQQRGAESLPDGFILYGGINRESFEYILNTGKPVVVVDFEYHETASVNIDNEKGAYTIAKHVLQGEDVRPVILGIRLIESDRVCRLTTADLELESKEISRSRLDGYLKAAKEQGCDIAAQQVWHIPINDSEYAEIAAREALTTTPRPNVLLCMSDVVALAALRLAKELNLRVPEDVQITGFDDIPESSRAEPPLTTICQQSIEKGRLAARLLLDKAPKENVVLETRLVLRGTTKS